VIKRVSAIIPTRNRAESLKSLLDSLYKSDSRCGTEIEIIVVNNGSTDHTADRLAEEAALPRPHSLIVIEEKQPGKSNAINRGLTVARGDILVVVDDDVRVDPQCLMKHVEAHEQSGYSAIQGRILPGKDPDGQTADPLRLREYNIPQMDYGSEVREIRGLTGTNMSFQRDVLEKVGIFDARLGPGASGFSEDTEFSVRIREAGFKIGYTPHAIVYHELNPVRYGRAYNRAVQYRKGLSRSIYRRDSIVFRVFPDLLANCCRYGFYSLLGLTQKVYKTEGRIMKYWGYLTGKLSRRPGARNSDAI
jgi:GT2 family glycosyltransferase